MCLLRSVLNQQCNSEIQDIGAKDSVTISHCPFCNVSERTHKYNTKTNILFCGLLSYDSDIRFKVGRDTEHTRTRAHTHAHTENRNSKPSLKITTV